MSTPDAARRLTLPGGGGWVGRGEAVIERARATHLAGADTGAAPVLSKEDLRNGHTGAGPDLRDRHVPVDGVI